jgi:hypothetical protein
VKDLEEKYAQILRRMDGEDPKIIAWDMLEDKNLPFSEHVRAYTMPDKFKMPRVEKYDGSGDPQAHLEAFREHIILHGTPKSVNTFKELGLLFLSQFLTTRKRKKSVTYLLTLR